MTAGGRYRLEVLTLCLAAGVAGLAVTVPIDFRWLARGSALDLQMLVFSTPRATATAALAAVGVAALCTAATVRSVWLLAWFSGALLLLTHLVAHRLTVGLATFGFVDAIVSGALLGALIVLTGGRRLALAGTLLGALSGIVTGNRITVPGSGGQSNDVLRWALVDPPPFLLILIAVVSLGGCAWLNRDADVVPVVEIPLRAVAAVLVLVTASLVRSEWLAAQDDWAARIVGGSVLIVIATLVAALLLPGRDGVLIALAVAFTAAGGAVGLGLRPGWMVPLLVVAVAVGLAAGVRWPRPLVAVLATIALAVFEALTVVPGGATALPVAGAIAVAAVGGYCFGVVVPQELSSMALALVTLIAPSLVAVVTSRRYDHAGLSKVWIHSPPNESWVPGWIAVLVTIACGVMALALRHNRSRQIEPSPPGGPSAPRGPSAPAERIPEREPVRV
ncbi:hypothetical protein ACFVUS_06875 [Nocardia sp. NPDC058058]|uniref:hypothetical protein n=1 Tax=Nocardia sp. NPDC058058 TaxID=3346317 RepID=UPI0036DEA854